MDDEFEDLLNDLFSEGVECANCAEWGSHYDEKQKEAAKEAICVEVRKLEAEVARLTAEREAVCEWKRSLSFLDSLDYTSVHTGCDHSRTLETEDVDDFTYCPYCGRKIKIVEA